MVGSILGLYGIYLIFVGINGNAGLLAKNLAQDFRGFIPWTISLLVISALAENDTTKDLVKPFLALSAIAFTLQNFPTIRKQMKLILDYAEV